MKNLRYSYNAAWDLGEERHVQEVLKELGISYFVGVPQTMAECWDLWCCEGVPEELPPYLTVLMMKPSEMIGHGLSPVMAAKIQAKMDEARPDVLAFAKSLEP